ncbi:hypothetical protein ABZV58_18335 [Nocardia sp. NPDC004654]|uniref:hypothetical protein n=1 Tax=Nocardia sp. NPDC004654 TaxID=3154776 RepID=UPI0033A98D53
MTRRWATMLAHAPRLTGHITLEQLLTGAPEDEPVTGLLSQWADQPLLCFFDGRGFAEGLVDELDPLTRTDVIAIYLHRKQLAVAAPSVELASDWYERGAAARHRAHAVGDDLDDLLDQLDGMLDGIGDFDTWTSPGEPV